MASDDVPIAEVEAPLTRRFDIVLKAVSHPEFGDIGIERDLFAVGRAEMPFSAAGAEIVVELSRRHAKLFFEHGAAYIADLGSKNGTSVNGEAVRERPRLLRDGDELRFAGVLAYRVEFVPRSADAQAHKLPSVVVTLTPERGDLGLESIVVTSFPFLISKADETFSRYRDAYPHQVNYVSRRHAHLFLAGAEVFVEDLGSTNGTFVAEKRLEDSAVALEDGARLAFGGNHFLYRVGIKRDSVADPTVTQRQGQPAGHDQGREDQGREAAKSEDVRTAHGLSEQAPSDAIPFAAAIPVADMDRTTFVAAPHSFLDIYCVDPARTEEDEVNPDALSHTSGPLREASRRRSGRFARFFAELNEALGGIEQRDMRRIARYSGAALALLCVLIAVVYVQGTPQRDMKSLLAAGRFADAAQLADRYLAQHPDDTAFRTRSTEAVMKAQVPGWLVAIKAHDFARARASIGAMQALARHNPELEQLVGALGWLGDLDAYWFGRGGAQAPIGIYRDEAVITALIARWNDDADKHQRALDQIASYVPEFAEPYADALSHLRQLESDEAVYVAALDRLKAAIETALNSDGNDRLDALPAMLDDYGARYPRLAGLASVRDDLRQYRQIEDDARSGRAQAASDALSALHFATPPFQARVPKLRALLAATAQGSRQ